MESYCLVDGEGDWWVWSGTGEGWCCIDVEVGLTDEDFNTRYMGFNAGMDRIGIRYGINGLESHRAESLDSLLRFLAGSSTYFTPSDYNAAILAVVLNGR